MCGIAGFVDKRISKEEAKTQIEAMLFSIRHRGPDNSSYKQYGPIVLGHNRLSIIDLAELANQPMEYGHLSLTYNGEIYNYLEIKTKLVSLGYKFKTQSDSEVLLAAYQHWGSECVKQFVGMWAFCIYDKSKNSLFCSRDRFGIKPFFYISKDGQFAFASEIKALRKSKNYKFEVNLDQVDRYYHLGWMNYRDETFFKSILSLPAAHNLTWRDGNLSIERYWDLDLETKLNIDFEEAKIQFRQQFEKSIKLHMRADVPIGSCLSGGLDSTAIVSMIGSHYSSVVPFKTYTIFYDEAGGVDESPYAKASLKRYSNLEGHFFHPKEEDVQHDFEAFSSSMDFPLRGSTFYSQYFVMKLAKSRGAKVLLNGQGADEYLLGYLRSFFRVSAQQFLSPKFFSTLGNHFAREEYSVKEQLMRIAKTGLSLLSSEERMQKIEYMYSAPGLLQEKKFPIHLERKSKDRVDNFSYHLLFNTELNDLLAMEDQNSMTHSIESRVPFLDHRLVELVTKLPTDFKINKGVTKYILREGLKDILPQKVYERKDKKGFVTPGEVKWLRGPLKHLLEANLKPLYFVNERKASQMVEAYKKGDNRNARPVWRLLMLADWLKRMT